MEEEKGLARRTCRKLLIFRQKTLAARYGVPSASHPPTRRSKIKIHVARLFSSSCHTGDQEGVLEDEVRATGQRGR